MAILAPTRIDRPRRGAAGRRAHRRAATEQQIRSLEEAERWRPRTPGPSHPDARSAGDVGRMIARMRGQLIAGAPLPRVAPRVRTVARPRAARRTRRTPRIAGAVASAGDGPPSPEPPPRSLTARAATEGGAP